MTINLIPTLLDHNVVDSCTDVIGATTAYMMSGNQADNLR